MTVKTRPISLKSVAGKILGKITVRKKLVNVLEANNITSDSRHGFCNKRSCLTSQSDSLHCVCDNWFYNIPSGIIFQDFHKAFDKERFERALSKLKRAGVGGNLAARIRTFLTGRKKRDLISA